MSRVSTFKVRVLLGEKDHLRRFSNLHYYIIIIDPRLPILKGTISICLPSSISPCVTCEYICGKLALIYIALLIGLEVAHAQTKFVLSPESIVLFVIISPSQVLSRMFGGLTVFLFRVNAYHIN